MTKNKYNKSYLQWAGGKGKALDHLLPVLEKHKQKVFCEPFIGAANVSLNFDAKSYIWNDLNRDLIESHKTILGKHREDVDNYIELCKELFEDGFEPYYDVREAFNNLYGVSLLKPAMFQYLNKHGFNGLMRYNKSGGFNTPKGTVTKSNKTVPTESMEYMRERHLGNTKILNTTFQNTFGKVSSRLNVLIYCDPPYVPMGESNFNYTGDGFGYDKQVELKGMAKVSPHTVIISNHWNNITKELYKDADEVYTFPVQRTISCKGAERIQVMECVVVYLGDTE